MKDTFRKKIKDAVCGYSPQEQQELSLEIIRKVESIGAFSKAKVVAAYWSLPGEVATHDAVRRWSLSKTVLLPVVEGENLVLKLFDPDMTMSRGPYGIAEPAGEIFTDTDSIDAVIVPGVGFDYSCARLGRGKGYYDRLLAGVTGVKIGVCFHCQLVGELPAHPHDVGMDIVVTDRDTIIKDGL